MVLRAVLGWLFGGRSAAARRDWMEIERRRGLNLGRWTAGAEARGLILLQENLTPIQAAQFSRFGYFDVVGSDTGKRYRIKWLSPANIDELDARGHRIRSWCFAPVGNLVMGDVLLAQKLALELYETEALSVANIFGDMPLPYRTWAGDTHRQA